MFDWINRLKPRRDGDVRVDPPATWGEPSPQSRYFEAFGEPRLKLTRAELSGVLQWAAIVLLLLIVWRMAGQRPIAQPFVVEEGANHELHISTRAMREFSPRDVNKIAEIQRWVRLVYTGDAAMTEANLLAANQMVGGKAVAELSDFIRQDAPIHRLTLDPLWTRAVESITTNLLSDNGTDVAIARVTLAESGASGQKQRSVVILTMHYVLIPPTTIEEAERVNPIGLRITHFSKTIEQTGAAQ